MDQPLLKQLYFCLHIFSNYTLINNWIIRKKSVSVTSIRWSVSTGHSAKLFYNGGTADQDICYLTGGGVWDSTNHFIPVGMGAAAGNSGSYLEIFK